MAIQEVVVVKEKRSPILLNMISGGVAGTAADAILHAIDTLKTRYYWICFILLECKDN